MKYKFGRIREILVAGLILAVTIMPLTTLAQETRIQAPKNRYTVQQDVQLGQQAASEVRRQMPVLSENSDVDRYVENVGRRLVAAIPREYQQSAFE